MEDALPLPGPWEDEIIVVTPPNSDGALWGIDEGLGGAISNNQHFLAGEELVGAG